MTHHTTQHDAEQAPGRLRIAVASPGDPYDRRTWSGSTYFIVKALEPFVRSLTWIGPLTIPHQDLKKRLAAVRHRITGLRTYPERTLKASQHFARCIDKRLDQEGFDLLLAPAASVETAHIETRIPLVYISDATFALMQEVYPIFSSMGDAAATEHRFEQAVINRADLLVYPSHWAARSAVTTYGADPDKVRVAPFGANLDTPPSREASLGRRVKGRLELLFLAKEWERKGGDIAFHTLKSLIDNGVDARLTVCGTVPPASFRHEQMTVIPYLNKNLPEERARFQEVLNRSHLLLLPTRAECYGVVFCEAAAYGLPVFATNVGGVGTIVENGVNGHLLPPDAGGADFARLIRDTALDPTTYMRLNTESRRRYEEHLNWDAWGRTMVHEISRVLRIKQR
ncbi:glycosyltransferase family 4 protein [Desulfoluna spongiiphila]|uniref:glycosyltransferase family 4 protein n=1 Tax=Desulfoluna spongiiphila TaxID=419481 RepID=UPI001257BF22|nr:glycosyltransferase family 4 protein [Desulfoluna spongiiphila]VVS91327.1 glycosyl transferase family 1 [Desulfoluna spongiiphila]